MEEVNTAPTKTAQHWYIAYTLPRHEKAIAQRLGGEKIPCYVPLYSETRMWRERRVKLELPLFPCYVFAKMHPETKARLLSAPGVVRMLAVSGAPVVFPDEEMDALQSTLSTWSAQPCPFHCSGKRVRLKSGPFAGLEGKIVRRNGKRKLIVTLDRIKSSMLLDIDLADAQISA
jgi:transcription antitermination factor NusG